MSECVKASDPPRAIQGFAVSLPPLIGAAAWIEWYGVPLLYPPDGSPLPYVEFIPYVLLLHLLCFLAIVISPAIYKNWKSGLGGVALPAAFLLHQIMHLAF